MFTLAHGMTCAVEDHIAFFEVFEEASRAALPRRSLNFASEFLWHGLQSVLVFAANRRRRHRMSPALKLASRNQRLTLEGNDCHAVLIDSCCAKMYDAAIRF